MVKVTKIDTPKPEQTKLYLGALLLSWIPYVGLAFSLNGVIRSLLKIIKSRKAKKTDIKAIVGILISSFALLISIVAINVTLNPTPSITVTNKETNTDDTSYTLTGKISNMENEGSELTINDVTTPLENGNYSYKVDLEEGDNIYNMVARNDNGEIKKTITIHRTTQTEFAARAEAERLIAEKKAEEHRAEEEKAQEKTKEAVKDESSTETEAIAVNSYPFDWSKDGPNTYLLLINEFNAAEPNYKNRVKATISDFQKKVPFTTNTFVGLTTSADVYRCETSVNESGYTIDTYRNCLVSSGGKDVYNSKLSKENIALYSNDCDPEVCINDYELIFYPDDFSNSQRETIYWKPN
jgi:hypothetical protein